MRPRSSHEPPDRVSRRAEAPIERIAARAFVIPTEQPESDGTLEWDRTTLVIVDVEAGGHTGLGYTYTHAAAAALIDDLLGPRVAGADAMSPEAIYISLVQQVRNIGRPGIAAAAISAVDIAIWDVKARILGLPLVTLLGAVRHAIPVYGSGGFTSYSIAHLRRQLGTWVDAGMHAVKMKVGRDADADRRRVEAARRAIGEAAELFVDANGAYDRAQALGQAAAFGTHGVTWFEEPVSSGDVQGLRLLRSRVPPAMAIAAGEYAWAPRELQPLTSAVDVLQADATRCGGVTGFLRAHAIADAAGLPLSTHTAPAIHVHLACAAARVRHLEYFHDHVRIEHMLFDGAPVADRGLLRPDRSRPGLGIALKIEAAGRFAV